MKATNKKISEFAKKLNHLEAHETRRITEQALEAFEAIESLEFVKFDNEHPFLGECKNLIFLTYSNHYSGNIGTWQSVGALHHPNLRYEDRGYIKGIALDLCNYMKLRMLTPSSHLRTTANVYFPRFRNSKHSGSYVTACQELLDTSARNSLEFCEEKIAEINKKLMEVTGISALYYVRQI